MGKATIESSLGEGQYAITLHFNTRVKQKKLDTLTQEKAALVARKAAFSQEMQTMGDALADLKTKESACIDAISAFQASQKSTYQGILDAIATLTGDVATKNDEVSSKQYTLYLNEQNLKALEAERDAILALLPPDNVPSPDLLESIASAKAYLVTLEGELSELTSALQTLTQQLTGKQSARDGFKFDIDKALLDALTKASAAVQSKQHEIRLLELEIGFVDAQIKANELAHANFSKLPSEKRINAWCVDYSTTLTGEVGTIEIPGEIHTIPVNLKPGFTDKAVYDRQADGELVSLEFMTPEQSWFNLAVLPYVNKFKPKHRRATIESIEGGLASITLEQTYTKQPGLEVTPKGKQSIDRVPFHYMDCDSLVFEAGDTVIVEFDGRDIEKPKIIGFAKEPKPCDPHGFGVTVDISHKIIKYKTGKYTVIEKPALAYGSLYRKLYANNKWHIASFDGPYAGVMLGTSRGHPGHPDSFAKPAVNINGFSLSAPGNVHGMALCIITDVVYLYIVAASSIYRCPFPATVKSDTSLVWQMMGSYGDYDAEGFGQYVTNNPEWVAPTLQCSLWEFNAACTEASAVFGALGGAGQIIGTWTGYNTLSLEWFDPGEGSITETVVIESYEGHYLSLQRLKILLWAGYKSDGIALDTLSLQVENTMQTPVSWSVSFGVPVAYYMHDVPEGLSTRQGVAEGFSHIVYNGTNVYEYSHQSSEVNLKLSVLRYLDPYLMACAIVGYDGDIPFCAVYKDWTVIISGDNITKNSVPPDYLTYATINSLFREINGDDFFQYQLLENTDGKLLACIHDYTRVSGLYGHIDAYSNAQFITADETGASLPALVGIHPTLMKIGLI